MISGAEIEDDMMAIDMQINCDSNNLISESLINHSSIVVVEKENDMTIEEKENNTATKNTKINNTENKSLILGIGTVIGMEAQKHKRRKESKIKTKKKQIK